MGDDSKAEPPAPLSTRIDGRSRWLRAPLAIEWFTEWLVYWLGRWALIDLIKLVGSLSIIWAGFYYVMTGDDRKQAALDQKKSKHYQEWQVINTAGRSANQGRNDALTDLISDGVSLKRIDLSNTVLDGIHAIYGVLEKANLSHTSLRYSCFSHADLSNANLSNTDLFKSDLSFADLREANLQYSLLNDVMFDSSFLVNTDLRYAHLSLSILKAKYLKGANIYGAHLDSHDFDIFSALLKEGAVCFRDDGEWDNSHYDGFRMPKFTKDLCAINTEKGWRGPWVLTCAELDVEN